MTEFRENDKEQSAQIRLGEPFEVTLGENPTTGFRWKTVSNGDPCCRLTDDHFTAGSLPGAEGIHKWSFQAAQKGDTKIEMILERPWAATEKPAKQFVLKLTVTE